MDKHELVSVIITTYNRADILKNAIQSVLAQTYPNIEIIIVDDCSEDHTEQIVKELSKVTSFPIKYIKLAQNSGANKARNTGIIEAKGRFITGLDDDDIMHPERIQILMDAYEDNYAFVFSTIYFVKNGLTQKKDFAHFKNFVTLNDLLYYNCVGNQVLAKKEDFLDAGLFDEKLIAAQDYDMWIKFLIKKRVAKKIDKPLLYVDRNEEVNRISSHSKKIKGYMDVYKKYKKIMRIEHKKFQLFKLLLLKGKKINYKTFFKLLVFAKLPLMSYLFLKHRVKASV